MSKIIFILICFSVSFSITASAKDKHPNSVTDTVTLSYLIGDGVTNQTIAIQAAIDSCSNAGGGTLIIPQGIYLIDPIKLKSHVNLLIDTLATLRADTVMANWTVGGSLLNLISGSNIQDVHITGRGTIDGSGAPWWAAYNANNSISRPRLVYITSCTNLTIDGITLKNSPSFHFVPNNCQNVIVNNVKVISPSTSPNTDGIDPSNCRNVLITNCTIDVGDDCIAIKAGRINGVIVANSSRDITVSNCTFLHGHGLSVGSETDDGMINLIVTGCTFNGTTNGIRLKSGTGLGGLMQNLYYSNITMTNVTNPIVVDLAYSTSSQYPSDIPAVNGFYINNLTVTGSNNAGSMKGLSNSILQNITFSNIHISAQTGMTIKYANNVTITNWTVNVQSGAQFIVSNVTNRVGF